MSAELSRELAAILASGDRRKIVRAIARLIHEQDRKASHLDRLRSYDSKPRR